MKKIIETSKGRWQVVEINSMQEGQYYVDIIGSFYYKLSEITEEEASSIVDNPTKDNFYPKYGNFEKFDKWYIYRDKPIKSLHSLLESQGIEITPNTYIFKV